MEFYIAIMKLNINFKQWMLSCARSLLLGMKMLQIIHDYIENVKKAFDEENI